MQASRSITRQYGGTGLGLAITQRILHLMKSDLLVESEPDKGSKFHFVIEFKLVDERTAGQLQNDISGFDLKGKHILLVEDTLFNVLYATQLLDGWHAKTSVADNGEIAVNMIKSETYDLILMDLQMPVMDGYTATREIRNYDSNIPIIALTASATADVKEKIQEAGMQDYIVKPFTPDELLIKLKRLLS
jgi:CheY-like chemotaxis protein